ncbi:hypothetical protein BKA70DRAFT_1223061 [Coprinopsis sp. MPI-PUGE-AT-0042]|nr:hypothetical protein BKA70DRAFT_1223061 [Coprinopsis sp. MPI-PUGE-AT-0042]
MKSSTLSLGAFVIEVVFFPGGIAAASYLAHWIPWPIFYAVTALKFQQLKILLDPPLSPVLSLLKQAPTPPEEQEGRLLAGESLLAPKSGAKEESTATPSAKIVCALYTNLASTTANSEKKALQYSLMMNKSTPLLERVRLNWSSKPPALALSAVDADFPLVLLDNTVTHHLPPRTDEVPSMEHPSGSVMCWIATGLAILLNEQKAREKLHRRCFSHRRPKPTSPRDE